MGSKKTTTKNVALTGQQLVARDNAYNSASQMAGYGSNMMNTANGMMGDLSQGKVSQPLMDSITAQINKGASTEYGNRMGDMNKRGLFGNNSLMQKGTNDLTTSVTDSMLRGYNDIYSNQTGLMNSLFNTGAGYMSPTMDLYGNELNFNKNGQTTTSGGGFSSFLGTVAGSLVGGYTGGLGKSWSGTGCFAGDTEIAMEDGSTKQIKDVEVGDILLGGKEVVDKYEGKAKPVIIETDKDNVVSTSEQPMFLYDSSVIEVGNIEPGEMLLHATGFACVDSITFEDEEIDIFDLAVEPDNCFYANGFAVLGGIR